MGESKKDSDMGLEKFVKFDVEELVTLRESYKVRIKALVEEHWLTKLRQKTKYNVSEFAWKLSVGLLFVGIGCFIALMVVISIGNKDILDYSRPLMVPGFVLIAIGGLLSQALDDHTGGLRRDLRNIELVLDNKQVNSSKKIMVDTNIFDAFVNGVIGIKDVEKAKKRGYNFYITHIQSDEVNNCKDNEKRGKLTLFMASMSPELVSTESTIFGLSRWGFSKLGDGQLIRDMNPGNKKKQSKDALIAEATIKNDYMLLTNDNRLRNKVHNLGGRAISIEYFIKKIR